MFKVVFLFFLFFGLVACNKAETLSNHNSQIGLGIIDGKPVTKLDKYAQVTVRVDFSDGYCTGVIIAQDFILTAGHCIKGHNPVAVKFYLPETGKYETRNVLNKDYHAFHIDSFSGNYSEREYDVGIVHFDGGLPTGFVPAKLGTEGKFSIEADQQVTVIGYGDTENSTEISLNFKSIQILMPLSDMEFLASPGICYGDSGGPALVDFQNEVYAVGISSRLWGDRKCGVKSVLTSVDYFRTWIEEKIAKMR